MAADGEYARLFSTQAKRYIEAAQGTEGNGEDGPAASASGPQGFRFPQGFQPPAGFKMPEGGFPRPPQGAFSGAFPGRGGEEKER